MRAGLGPQARVYAEPNRKIRIWNDEGKSTFCEIGLQFRPLRYTAPRLILIRRVTSVQYP